MENNAYISDNPGIDGLVDIRDVSVDKTLPKDQRIADFVRQIRDPYRFRYGDFVVSASFSDNGVTLEDCLVNLFQIQA